MFFDRKKLEEIESQILAPYATHARDSKGRAHAEPEPDYRTAFQRDRDRILHTTAFRRLEYKTQVFINYEGDYYRTRLTHTLEVAQIGRTIARALGANEDLVETISLAHDLGHPPFGHSGEAALNAMMKDHGGFDHNRQSFRIVTEIEQRYPSFPGLNLTWEVLEGMVKHETAYDWSDASGFDPQLRGSLEAQITNVSDELAYTAHDLDDGLRSNLIRPEMLEDMDLWKMVIASLGIDGLHVDDLTRHQIIRELIGIEVTHMIYDSNMHIQDSGVKTLLELQSLPSNIVHFDAEMQIRNKELRDFLYQNMYRQYRVVRMSKKAERVLSDLFTAYVTEPTMLPRQFQDLIAIKGLERTVCDYLAGMTDRFAVEEYQKLFDPSLLP